MAAQNLKLAIDGMHCGACVKRVTAALEKIDGVAVKSVDVGAAEVTYEEEKVEREVVIDAVDRTGFTAHAA